MIKTYSFILKAFLLTAIAIRSDDMAFAQQLQGFQYEEGAIIRGDTASNTIFLVFTGGDYNDGGPYIRKVLKELKVPAHFFFTGDFYRKEENKALVEGLKQDGHFLGAHSDKHLLYASWDNRDSLLIDEETFVKDLKDNYRAMAAHGIAAEAAPFFLPPYEWYNATISRWTKEQGLQLVNFSPGTRSNADYTTPDMGDRYLSSDAIYKSIMDYEAGSANGLNGFLLLIHIGTHPDRTDKFYYRLEELIGALKKREYRFALLTKAHE